MVSNRRFGLLANQSNSAWQPIERTPRTAPLRTIRGAREGQGFQGKGRLRGRFRVPISMVAGEVVVQLLVTEEEMRVQKSPLFRRTFLLLGALPVSLFLSGCLVIPHSRNIATANGIQRKKPKLEFLKEGTTTKADVSRELGDFNTNASQERFIWSRWQQVKVQTEWFFVGSNGYSGGVAGGSTRAWVIKNVLAGFDDNEILAKHLICSDDGLINCINAMIEYTNLEGASGSLQLPAWRGRRSAGRVNLGEGQLTFENPDKPTRNFVLPLSSVDRLTAVHGGSPEILRLSLHFREGTKPVDALSLEASPEEAMRLMWLLRSRR